MASNPTFSYGFINYKINPTFSYELIDNKIPCGGFNLLGGGVKGRNIESKEVQSLIFSLYADDRADKSVTPQRLLILNCEDYVKINPILRNPPSETKVVASNLRFTCLNYYDYLQFANQLTKVQSEEELESIFNKATNGNIVTLYDIANLYTKELGIKTVPWNDEGNLTDSYVEQILQQYYQQEGSFMNWIKKTTVWAALEEQYFYGINQKISEDSMFKDFVLDFTTEGNTLTYVKPQK